MRKSLGILVLALASQAQAIGFCEDVEDSARVVRLGPDRVAVERVQEICDEEEGEERRRKLLSVEILDLTGNALARYARGGTPLEDLSETVGDAKPEAELTAALDALKPAEASKHPVCTLKPKRSEGVLTFEIEAKGKTIYTQEVTDQVDPEAPLDAMLKTFWLQGGVVIEARVPLSIDQGALGKAPGTLSTVMVLGPEVLSALAVCVEAAPQEAPKEAPPSAEAPKEAPPSAEAPKEAPPSAEAPPSTP